MRKRILAVVLSIGMVMSFAACGNSSDSTPANKTETDSDSEKGSEATQAPVDDTSELQDSLNKIAAALDGTCWVGMNSEDYTCYALGFKSNQVAFYSNIEGDAGLEGYWNISADNLNFYEDEACSKSIGSTTWSFDVENNVMVLGESAIMAQVEGDMATAADALQKYASTAKVGEYLDNTVWAGTDENASSVLAFTFKDGEYYMGITDLEGNVLSYKGTWSIDYDKIYLNDENGDPFDSLAWSIKEDGSELDFTVDSSQVSFYLAQTNADNIEAAMNAIADTITEQ